MYSNPMVTIRYAAVRLQRLPQTRATSRHQSRGFAGLSATLMPGLYIAVLAAAMLAGRRYIDTGSGSFAVQITFAAELGELLTARLWLRHIY